jgi:hypothetical protein
MLSSAVAWYVLCTAHTASSHPPLLYRTTHSLTQADLFLLVVEAEPAVLALMVQGEESSWRMASAHERAAAALPFNAHAYGAQVHPTCFLYYVSSLSTLFFIFLASHARI